MRSVRQKETSAIPETNRNGKATSRVQRCSSGCWRIVRQWILRELEQVAWLALQCLADRLEGGEPNGARLSSLEDGEIRERDTDSFREIGQRRPTGVQHVVELYDDGHGQTVPSSSSRMRAPGDRAGIGRFLMG